LQLRSRSKNPESIPGIKKRDSCRDMFPRAVANLRPTHTTHSTLPIHIACVKPAASFPSHPHFKVDVTIYGSVAGTYVPINIEMGEGMGRASRSEIEDDKMAQSTDVRKQRSVCNSGMNGLMDGLREQVEGIRWAPKLG
jgi:hypothetical protein